MLRSQMSARASRLGKTSLLLRRADHAIRAAALLLSLLPLAFAAAPTPAQAQTLTTAQQVHDLPGELAAKALPTHLVATVTYYQPEENTMFVEDASGAVYVRTDHRYPVHQGDLVDIVGVTAKSFRTIVKLNPQITLLKKGTRLPERESNYRDLMAGKLDCRYVWLEGVVRSASLDDHGLDTVAQLEVLAPGGLVQVFIQNPGGIDLAGLLEAKVRISGIVGGEFDARWQLMRTILYASSPNELRVVRPPPVKPLALPLTAIDDIVQTRYVTDQSTPVRVRGTVMSYQPGYSAVIQNEGGSLLVHTRQINAVPVGAVVDVVGYADDREYGPALDQAEIFPTGQLLPVTPRQASYQQAANGTFSDTLISLTGNVLSILHGTPFDSLVITVESHPVTVLMQTNSGNRLPDLPVGTLVRVAGICRITPTGSWGKPVLFRLDISGTGDVQVIARPSWWTRTHLLMVICALLALSSAVAVWAMLLRKRVEAQTHQIERAMQIERERSRLLEQINSQTPMEGLLDDICCSIGTLIGGVYCFCDVLGQSTKSLPCGGARRDTQRTLYEAPIADAHGSRIATFRVHGQGPRALSQEDEEILLVGTGLLSLAVNQRRMYEELNYHSTHDQLTGLANRRLAEERLESVLLQAERCGASFGVAYIDVDRFKQVNDRYGHKSGDLYLQQIAARLAGSIRAGDLIARIGGDEFLLVASGIKSIEDGTAYKTRLETCFETIFEIEGECIYGSVSIGLAVYPHHGTSPEELKRHADAEMYADKHRERTEPAALDSALESTLNSMDAC